MIEEGSARTVCPSASGTPIRPGGLTRLIGCAGGGVRRLCAFGWSYGRMPIEDEPRVHGMLDVGHGQQIYWEEWGSPDGSPAL